MLRPTRSPAFHDGPVWASGTAATSAALEPVAALSAFALLWWGLGITPTPVDRLALLLILALSFPAPDHLLQGRAERSAEVALNAVMLVTVLLVCAWASGNLQRLNAVPWLAWACVGPMLQMGLLEAAVWVHRAMLKRRPALRCLVVGAGPLGVRTARALRRAQVGSGVRRHFVGWVAPGLKPSLRRLGSLGDLQALVTVHRIDEVYLALDHSEPQVLQALQDTAASVFLVPDVASVQAIQGRWLLIDELPVVALTQSPYSGVGAWIKRAMDFSLAALVLAFTWPLMLAIALWIRLDSPGPALFRQRRLGLGGQTIEVWKFRTMRVMQDGDVVPQARPGDARITRAGRVLRRTSLDEWPQFINVLQGRMSLVGPRPHALAHNEFYRHCVPAYMVRHLVRPGITGWAQIHGLRGETQTTEQMRRRIEYDLDYLRRWSPGLDLRILWRTVGVLAGDARAW